MIQLNLLPEIKREYLKARRVQNRVISISILISVVSLGLVALAGFWVYAVQNIHKAALTSGIEKKSKELKSIPDINKYVTIQNQLGSISGLHSNKIIMSRVLDVMAKLNPKAPNNVRISNLEVDSEASTMLITGETDTFTGLETFRDTLKNASLVYTPVGDEASATERLFEPANIVVISQGLGKAQEGEKTIVIFKLSAQYNPLLLARDSNNIAIQVPDKETTQSKQDSPSVFAESQAKTEGGE